MTTNQTNNMNTEFNKLHSELVKAMNDKREVTCVKIDGWIDAQTGIITKLELDKYGELVVMVDGKSFVVNDDDIIHYDDTQQKHYYGITCKDLPHYSLTIIL